jgi:hypothetical protein
LGWPTMIKLNTLGDVCKLKLWSNLENFFTLVWHSLGCGITKREHHTRGCMKNLIGNGGRCFVICVELVVDRLGALILDSTVHVHVSWFSLKVGF